MTLDGYIESLRGKRVAVVGVGVSNRPLIELLLGAHLNVSVRDMRPAEKLGAEAESYAARGAEVVHVPGFKVKVVDTTAAGDTFNAGFAAGLALGLPPLDAVKVGHAAAALSVTAFGAQGGMPRMEQLLPLLADGWKEKLGL